MAKKEVKKAYMCEIDWNHELGETKTSIYPASKKYLEKHHTASCGIVEVEVSLKRTVKKAAPYDEKNTITALEFTKLQIKSTEKIIKEKTEFLKKLKKELKDRKQREKKNKSSKKKGA